MANEAPKTPVAVPPAPVTANKDDVQANAPRPAMGEGVVARGRTVLAPTDEREVVGYKDDGTPRFRFKDKPFGEGETVRLPQDEINHLRRAGFLVDPNKRIADVATGPTLTNVNVPG